MPLSTESQHKDVLSVDDLLTAFFAKFEKLAPFLLVALIVYVFIKGLAEAASTAVAGDEIFTLTLARQPHVSILWDALVRGADGQPPLFYLTERFFLGFISNPHIALRLPSVLAFCCTATCVYLFVRRHASSGHALLCVVFLLNTSLYLVFSVQARPYGLVAAGVAFAMICYQRVPNPFWTILLLLSFALLISLHYYAVFAVGAFAVAEAVSCWTNRKMRLGVWLSIFASGLPLIKLWPILTAQKQMYGQHFWAQPSLSGVVAAYGYLFQLPAFLGMGLVLILGLGLLVAERWPPVSVAKDPTVRAVSLSQERALVLAMLVMPVALAAAARIAHAGFMDRYVIWVAVGVAVGIGHLLPRLSRTALAALAIFLLITTAGQEFRALHSLKSRGGEISSPAITVERLIRSAGHDDLPVVVWADYLVISSYASPEAARRLVTVTDPASALTYIGTDTTDKLYSAMSHYGPFQVVDFRSFTEAHHAFLFYSDNLYATQGTTVFYDWWIPRLMRDGYSLQLVAAEGNAKMYLVRAPDRQ